MIRLTRIVKHLPWKLLVEYVVDQIFAVHEAHHCELSNLVQYKPSTV